MSTLYETAQALREQEAKETTPEGCVVTREQTTVEHIELATEPTMNGGSLFDDYVQNVMLPVFAPGRMG